VRLGRRQIDERFMRFVRTALPALAPHSNDVNYVDMRYSNGFAVGWKNSAPPPRGATTPDNAAAAAAPDFAALQNSGAVKTLAVSGMRKRNKHG
jgi:hypothetical protein